MSDDRTKGRRTHLRAFRPALDGGLEPRLLLSHSSSHVSGAVPGHYIFQIAHGGNALQITTPNGDVFRAAISGNGTVRGHALRNGTVTLTVQGTDNLSVLNIDPITPAKTRGSAHTFSPAQAVSTGILKIGALKVTSGIINQVNGYHTADLYGPLTIAGPSTVDRISLNAIQPGGSITVGGILNTLDILTNATLDGARGSTGVQTGSDLNFLSVGGNLSIVNGANVSIGRDLGLFFQPNKGTGPAGQGASIIGNLTVGNGSTFRVARMLDGQFLIYGFTSGLLNIQIPNATSQNFFPVGGFSL